MIEIKNQLEKAVQLANETISSLLAELDLTALDSVAIRDLSSCDELPKKLVVCQH